MVQSQTPFAINNQGKLYNVQFNTSPLTDSSIKHHWVWLAATWSIYYVAVHTIGRYEEYTQRVIWIGGLFVGFLTVLLGKQLVLKIPNESKMLFVLLIWSITGLIWVDDIDMYIYYFRLLIQFFVIIFLMTNVIKYSGGMNWMYIGFILTAAFNLFAARAEGDISLFELVKMQTRQDAVGGGPNTLGWYGFLGFLGAIILLGESKANWQRVALLVGGAMSLMTVVASASRGAFVSLAISALLWPFLCLRVRLKKGLMYLTVISALILCTFVFKEYIYSGSLLSDRMQKIENDESKRGSRLDLLSATIQLVVEYPITGAGLGQFGSASGTRMYSHTEVAELVSTTGIIGFGIYISMYYFAWRRMKWSMNYLTDRLIRYRINCARMALIVVIISGALFKPHFLVIASTFLIATIIGTSHWAERQVQLQNNLIQR